VKGWGGTWRAAGDTEVFTFMNVKVLLFAMHLRMSKSIALFEVSRASRVRLSDNNGVEMKMSEEHWWNGTGGKAKYWERNLSKWHYARRNDTGTRFF